MLLRSRVAVAATAAGLVTALFGTSASAAPAPGAAGVGDAYYPNDGNGGYDVSHYNIRITYNPATDLLTGSTTILARSTQELSSFNLDFLLPIKSVRVNNFPARVTANAGEVTVTPPAAIGNNQNLTIVVQYEGKPSTVKDAAGANYWKKTPDGALAVDEPHIAKWWFPSNDHPTDKATYDVSVVVPQGVEALSNGTFAGTQQTLNGWVRWNWRTTSPQATYLAFLAVGQFEIRTSTAPNGQQVVNAYGDNLGANGPAARASVERTPEVIEFLETQFGPYPFEAQGGVVSTGLGFALETQTRPVYSTAFFPRGANTSVVAHELAHQWFGDSVSVQSWRNIWLNEGFARYSEWLWAESQAEGTAAEIAQYYYDRRPDTDPFWQVVVGEPGSGKEFDIAVYDRGALAVHAFRNAVGDEDFFKILKTWQATKKYGNGKIEEFIGLAERISGKPLFALFQTWLFTKGKPAPEDLGNAAFSARSAKAATPPKAIEKLDLTRDTLARTGHLGHGHSEHDGHGH
ncbi:peptidase [Actinosynnema sp. ALI-1.44]|uniref:M1 family metallopeptidase n=1 Tax=Actinosynnema sp. ALI-1.44 TaxID=1933779 RepID=UPI00097BC8EF|nr:M1 family metallopeptidase [Actinosynnema sp. ALI-1.44]ONI73234.1 peptidase [Actinosynnema sp. ALI-1.44]